MADNLPGSVRYVKNGAKGRWWKAAKDNNQVHAGWRTVPHDVLRRSDFPAIERHIRSEFGGKPGATQDYNALRTLLENPSRHVWITFEKGCMWWCTVRHGINTNPDGDLSARGHFWLTCALPWSNHSIDGKRHLALSELPGQITAAAGFKGTVCTPKAWKDFLRIIKNEVDTDAQAARIARNEYQTAIGKLIKRLGWKDFELLVELILSRTGWVRIARLGGVTEGIDVEVENLTSDEIAFVQVKGKATQAVLDHYVSTFNEERERFSRMIFAVHSPDGDLKPPQGLPVQIWAGDKVSELVVGLGLGDWVAKRL